MDGGPSSWSQMAVLALRVGVAGLDVGPILLVAEGGRAPEWCPAFPMAGLALRVGVLDVGRCDEVVGVAEMPWSPRGRAVSPVGVLDLRVAEAGVVPRRKGVPWPRWPAFPQWLGSSTCLSSMSRLWQCGSSARCSRSCRGCRLPVGRSRPKWLSSTVWLPSVCMMVPSKFVIRSLTMSMGVLSCGPPIFPEMAVLDGRHDVGVPVVARGGGALEWLPSYPMAGHALHVAVLEHGRPDVVDGDLAPRGAPRGLVISPMAVLARLVAVADAMVSLQRGVLWPRWLSFPEWLSSWSCLPLTSLSECRGAVGLRADCLRRRCLWGDGSSPEWLRSRGW